MKIFKLGSYSWLLVILIYVHLIVNLAWLTINNGPIPWDPAAHTWIALDISEKIRSLNLIGIINSSNYYPVFTHTLSGIFLTLMTPFLGDPFLQVKVVQFSATLLLIATLLILFFYTKLLFKSEKIAFLSTAIFSFFPIVFGQSKWLYLDIPLTGVLIFCIYFLEKSNFLTKGRDSLYFFIAAGLLLMTKWTGVIYLVIPALFTLYKIIKSGKIKASFKNILFGTGVVLLIISPWYFTNFESLREQTSVNIIGEKGADPQNLLSFDNLILYLRLFINYLATPVLAFIFFISVLTLFRDRVEKIYYLIGMIVFGYVGFTFISNKDPRYIMPILPFVAILISLALNKLSAKPFLIRSLIPLLLVVYFIYYLILNFRPVYFEGTRVSLQLPIVGGVNIIDVNEALVKIYERDIWRMDVLLEDFNKINKKPVKLLIASEYEHINPSNVSAYIKSARIQKIQTETPYIYLLVSKYNLDKFPNAKELENYLTQMDYALVPVEQVGTEFLRNKPALEQIRLYFNRESLLRCSEFTEQISNTGSKCFVDFNETLSSGSDLSVDGGDVNSGPKEVKGPATVYCPWGCSFGLVTKEESRITYQLIKTYTLPNNEHINLYKIN